MVLAVLLAIVGICGVIFFWLHLGRLKMVKARISDDDYDMLISRPKQWYKRSYRLAYVSVLGLLAYAGLIYLFIPIDSVGPL